MIHFFFTCQEYFMRVNTLLSENILKLCTSLKMLSLQYDLLNVLYGCKMALRTLDFSQVKPTITLLRERRARAPKDVWVRFPWCDRKARCACFAVTHLRCYVVMGPRKQRSFHRYSFYRANWVTHSVCLTGSSLVKIISSIASQNYFLNF